MDRWGRATVQRAASDVLVKLAYTYGAKKAFAKLADETALDAAKEMVDILNQMEPDHFADTLQDLSSEHQQGIYQALKARMGDFGASMEKNLKPASPGLLGQLNWRNHADRFSAGIAGVASSRNPAVTHVMGSAGGDNFWMGAVNKTTNLPTFAEHSVTVQPEALKPFGLDKFRSDQMFRQGAIGGVGGAALGGALGSAVGALSSSAPADLSNPEFTGDLALGGAIGAGVGGLSGATLGALRGRAMGTGMAAANFLNDAASRHLGAARVLK